MGDIPRPGGPYADEIIGPHWPGTSESALLDRASWAQSEAAAMSALVPAITAAWSAYRAAADAHMFEEPAAMLLRAAHMVEMRADQYRAMAVMFQQIAHTIQGVKSGITGVVVAAQTQIAALKAAATAQMAAASMTPGAAAGIAAQAEAQIRAIVDGAKAEVAALDGLAAGASSLPKFGSIGPGGVGGPGGGGPRPPGRAGMDHTTPGPTPPPTIGPPRPRLENAADPNNLKDVFDQARPPGGHGAPEGPPAGPKTPTPGGDTPGPVQNPPTGSPGGGTPSPGTNGMVPDGGTPGPGDHGITDIGGGRNAPDGGAVGDGGNSLFGDRPGPGGGLGDTGDGGGANRVEPLPWLGNGNNNGGAGTVSPTSTPPPPAVAPGPQGYSPSSPMSPSSPAAPVSPQVTPSAPAATPTTPSPAPAPAPAGPVGQQVSVTGQPQGSAPGGGGQPSPTAAAAAESAANTSGQSNNMRSVAAAAFAASAPMEVVLGALDPDANLALAETVVAALLAASPAMLGLEWAASVVSAGTGQQVLVTSNEGRGWIPPRVHLPRDVESPWLVGEVSSSWELVNDAGRVLVEHAHANGDRYQLLALASTRAISSTMRARFPDARFSTVTRADDALDLGPKSVNTLDRLSIGVPEMSSRINAVADGAVAIETLGLVWDANYSHLGWVSPMTLPGTQVTAAAVREQILATMNRERDRGFEAVPDHMWQKLTELDGLARSGCVSAQLTADGIPVGGLVDDPASILRAMTAERRVNELVLLLNGRPSRARLRHIYFAYDQVIVSERASLVSQPV